MYEKSKLVHSQTRLLVCIRLNETTLNDSNIKGKKHTTVADTNAIHTLTLVAYSEGYKDLIVVSGNEGIEVVHLCCLGLNRG